MSRLKFGICPTEGGHFFREALAEVERAEALGLDSVWLAEHHGVRDHYWPAPVQMLTALAARTSRVLLGANVCVFPFYHPVRLAEETALLDVVSNGRAVLGVAIGYKPDEFLLYDAAAREARGALRGGPGPDEGPLDAGRRDAPGRALHGGGRADRAQARPAAAPARVDRRLGRRHAPARGAARGRLAAGPHGGPRRVSSGARPRSASTGGSPGSPSPAEWPVTRELCIAETEREARELADRHLMLAYGKEYGGTWKHPFIDAATAADLDRLAVDRFLIGTPDRIVRDLEPFVRQYGMTHVIFRLFTPGMPHRQVLRQIELLAREVVPAFR